MSALSAREELEKVVDGIPRIPGRLKDMTVKHILDLHARELAEKIRAEEPDLWTDDYEVFQRAADLIDPEEET